MIYIMLINDYLAIVGVPVNGVNVRFSVKIETRCRGVPAVLFLLETGYEIGGVSEPAGNNHQLN